jgi:protoheme IX farnesyltransferase
MIGMFMAWNTEASQPFSLQLFFWATLGIAMLSAAAAVFNCLIEKQIDAKMARTAWRPLPSGNLSINQTLIFAILLGATGFILLITFVNSITAYLTLATFAGYAFLYTVVLKPLTPQNIVIGGASGAMPPVLGWAAVNGSVSPEAWLLFLIIFVWTPPHFWALALYRVDDYKRTGLPMLPVTHGSKFTRLQILLYASLLFPVALAPVLVGMSSYIYLVVSSVATIYFIILCWKLYIEYSERTARYVFRYSIYYLSLVFAGLIIDKLVTQLFL